MAEARAALPRSPFFMGYAAALLASLALLPLAARRLFHFRTDLFAAALLAVLALVAIHFRHGMYLATKFNAYVMNPQPRVDLAAPSSARRVIVAQHSPEPARVAGLRRRAAARASTPCTGSNIRRVRMRCSMRYHHELLEAAGIPTTWGWRYLALKEDFVRRAADFTICSNVR